MTEPQLMKELPHDPVAILLAPVRVSVRATGRRDALDAARAAIAEWLEVAPDAFDVET